MRWLCAAQDASGGRGVAAFYDLRTGEWGPPYPETTGYIISTIFEYARLSGDRRFTERGVRMAEWLLELQLESGAFPIGPLWPEWEPRPIVFDTGQILQGLVCALRETGQERYLQAAVRAGDWLVRVQDPDGCWRQFTSQGIAHAYNARTAWALLELGTVSGHPRHQRAGKLNLEWTLEQQDEDGWYEGMSFWSGENPLTHTIAYTIEGVLEGGLLLGDNKLVASATTAAERLRTRLDSQGMLPGRFDRGWEPRATWTCPTGTAQMARLWLRLAGCTGSDLYRSAGEAANHYLKQRQARRSRHPGVAGGLPGSYPVYHEYEPFRHLNWAAKFFADSLMAEAQIGGGLSVQRDPALAPVRE